MAQWINPDSNFDFIGRARTFFTVSVVLVAATVATLGVRRLTRGEMLDYGTDFRGGSEVQIEFARPVEAGAVRAALAAGGHAGAEVVRLEQKGKHAFLLRLSEVSAYTAEQSARARGALEAKVGKGQLKRFELAEGGDKLYLRFAAAVEPATIEETLKGAGLTPRLVEAFGRSEDHAYQVSLAGIDDELRKLFDGKLGAGAVQDIPQIESVGAKVGGQLRAQGVQSVVWTLLLITLYVWMRFEVAMGIGGVVALLHDVLVVTLVWALTWREFTLQTVAALLTIGGYSINDTIVVFDRIRENLGRLRDRKLPLLINTAINETLGRTLMTSLTTIFATACITYFTRGPVRDFGLALTIGIVVGTYSSIFIASPIYLWLHEWMQARKNRQQGTTGRRVA